MFTDHYLLNTLNVFNVISIKSMRLVIFRKQNCQAKKNIIYIYFTWNMLFMLEVNMLGAHTICYDKHAIDRNL